MLSTTAITIFLGVLLTTTNAVPYSKYGRTCKDIGCRSNEVCVMAEDPCSIYERNSCGRYPTCQLSSSGGESCTTKICPTGQYCKTENGRPTCINTTPALAPAGRRPPGYDRPRVTPKPVIPTPPPRSSSFDNRSRGQSGHRNSIGSGSIWDRLFGGGSSRTRPNMGGGGGYQRPTSRPTSRPSPSNYYPGGKDHYTSHTTTDSRGNKVWTFSG